MLKKRQMRINNSSLKLEILLPNIIFMVFGSFFLFAIPKISYSQNSECFKIKNRQLKKQYDYALELFRMGRKNEGKKMLEQIVGVESRYVNAWYALADYNYHKGMELATDSFNQDIGIYFQEALQQFDKVILLCPSFNDYKSYFYKAEYYYLLREFSQSKFYILQFLEKTQQRGKIEQKGKKYLKNINLYAYLINNPVPFEPKIIEGVSSRDDEYLPFLSPDGDWLFYTHRYKKKLNNYQTKQWVEEFTVSKRLNNPHNHTEAYSVGIAMPYPFNTQQRNEGAASLTIDNKQMYITVCETKRASYTSYRNCDIYKSNFRNGNWQKMKNLGDSINGIDSWEGQPSITADGNVLFFSSNRKGGYGGMDIYKSTKDSSGLWHKAVNLGKVINTAKDEKSPFIHYDNQTLYFASNGHFGLGGFDIFYSSFTDSGWSKPTNIGFPINTQKDEVGLMLNTNGKKMYFASNNLAGIGGYDIYSSIVYPKARPKKVLFIKGQLFDEAGSPLQNALVELQSIQTKKITQGLVDSTSGKYAVSVPVKKGEEFLITARKKGYFYATEYINPFTQKFEPPTNIELKIKPIQKGRTYILENVNFEFNSSELSDTTILCINNLVDFLIENPSLHIQLRGHTDDVGNAKSNMDLSIARARAVRKQLINSGIKAKRISYKGFGEKIPLVSATNPDARALNRRVEFVVISK